MYIYCIYIYIYIYINIIALYYIIHYLLIHFNFFLRFGIPYFTKTFFGVTSSVDIDCVS